MKEELSSILISDGWETDANDKLVGVVIPSTVETYQAPTKVTFNGSTLNWIPSSSAALQEFVAPNIAFSNDTVIRSYANITTLTIGATAITATGTTKNCFGMTKLVTANFPNLTSITDNGAGQTGGSFRGCTSMVSFNADKLTTISCTSWSTGTFYGDTSLHTINFPLFSSCSNSDSTGGVFYGCTGLISVTLGSEGHPVTSIGAYTFNQCTQSGLTITIYTTNGASLSGQPWGATNAAIVYESA